MTFTPADGYVWCVDPGQTRHLQFLLEMPDDLGARSILRRHYECSGHKPGYGATITGEMEGLVRSKCGGCDADLVLLPAELATEKHVGPRRMGATRQAGSETSDH